MPIFCVNAAILWELAKSDYQCQIGLEVDAQMSAWLILLIGNSFLA
jgi:hypothetical protein